LLPVAGGFWGLTIQSLLVAFMLAAITAPPLQPCLELRPICGRYFDALVVIMMPSHDIRVQGRALCSDRSSTCDCSRRAASRYLVGSSPRFAHSRAHRAIAREVSCHSPRRISCGVSCCDEHRVRGSSDRKTQIRDLIFSSSQIVFRMQDHGYAITKLNERAKMRCGGRVMKVGTITSKNSRDVAMDSNLEWAPLPRVTY
jgi:hypothetical protein